MKNSKAICNECGRSVKFGTGLFVNRIPDFNNQKERVKMLKPFPKGDFICIECEEKLDQSDYVGDKRISN